MARITEEQRAQTEARIRAAMDRLLSGSIPPGGACDVKTLAVEAGVSRTTAFYPPGAYVHLRAEFEQRAARLREAGEIVDPRAAQIERLKADEVRLRDRIGHLEAQIAELKAFRQTAISRLAAQHQEILRLRERALPRSGAAEGIEDNVRHLAIAKRSDVTVHDAGQPGSVD